MFLLPVYVEFRPIPSLDEDSAIESKACVFKLDLN